MPHIKARDSLSAPLAALGALWASSPLRPRVTEDTLQAWDTLLQAWLASDLPLILRDGRRRGEWLETHGGRRVVFGDNTPANWAFGLALAGETPGLEAVAAAGVQSFVPLTFLTKGSAAKRDLNKAGWKVCHIDPVSDRKRYAVETAAPQLLHAEFLRFLSPRNIFLVPKSISGAGEIPEVISAIAAFEKTSAETCAVASDGPTR